MLLRHKVPTIFNIYMLDVICCALGCVILLWQVSHQEAETQTAAAKDSRSAYETARANLLSASNDVTQLQASLTDWQQKYKGVMQTLASAEKDRDDFRKLAADRHSTLTLSAAQLKKLEADLEKILAEEKKTKAELTGIVKLNADLLARLAMSDKQVAALKGDINLKKAELDKADKQVAALKGDIDLKKAELDKADKKSQDQLADLRLSESEARKLKQLLDALKDEHKDVQAKLKLTELQLRVRDQDLSKAQKDALGGSKELLDAKTLIAALTAERGTLVLEKDKLNKRVVDLQAEVEQRFAGIPLTGENVIFLIDISGSMTMKDGETDDPEKWPFLCETLMKLMRSIPSLQRFQVILFSDKTSYLFGGRDSWFKYEGVKTAEMTRDALRKVKVEGGTNMSSAFEEAFRYRKQKLDTIYIFSDGLPNLGDGVPTTVKNPTEAEKGYYMGKHIREKLKSEWNRPSEGLKEVRINAVGFFFESPDVGAFLWALAREHKGSFVGLR